MNTDMERQPYDHRNCQSLFGYAAAVHERSGAICQLCGAGADRLDFDLWRQLTVEHLIGESQGGYLAQIRRSLRVRLPDLPQARLEELARAIDAANTITACSFCNSTTSRGRVPVGMKEAIEAGPDDPEALFTAVTSGLSAIADQNGLTSTASSSPFAELSTTRSPRSFVPVGPMLNRRGRER